MASVEEIINFIFGGQVDASKIVTILVGIYAVVKSITEWIAKKKLIKTETGQTKLLEELKKEREENQELKKAIGKFGDIIITSYLSSNTIPVEVKRSISTFGSELNKIAQVPLADTTTKLIDVVANIAPDSDIVQHKEELTEATQVIEDVIDEANDLAQAAIDKITV